MLRSVSILLFLLVLLGACNEDEPETPPTTVSDADGNIYNTVTIGTQTWITENLKTTKYNDGTEIPLVTDSVEWSDLRFANEPAYCWYDNDQATYDSTYGTLYNWYAVTGKLCPTGWHVPTDSEWTTLTNFLGGEIIAGSELKEAGTTHWLSPNTGSTNQTGFTALPGGSRTGIGEFVFIEEVGYWWSASTSEDSPDLTAWTLRMGYFNSEAILDIGSQNNGSSVRCVLD